MARYFFDLVDGGKTDKDDVGLEFEHLADARAAAADALGDVTREVLPNGARRHLVMKVRDIAGNYVHECSVDFNASDARGPE
ncbi:DUF6894 family protein [Georhizobium sp. MAB10]|uniref:DUF6894 family protein n=1 Tax=Georhizobium sp. MAB10 TaxID=3028319 RepID=UPI003855F1C4